MLRSVSSANGHLELKFDDQVGEITSLKFKGVETLKSPKEGKWPKSWPVMFPICGALTQDTYLHKGKPYKLTRHGFFRSLKWDITETGTELVAKANNIEDFRDVYPFDYDLKLTIALDNDCLVYAIEVTNNGDEDLPYSTGHHGAFLVSPGNAKLVLDAKTHFTRHPVAGMPTPHAVWGTEFDGKDLSFDEECHYQAVNVVARSAKLLTGLGHNIELSLNGWPILSIWSLKGENWLCVEPWTGNQDMVTVPVPREIVEKDHITLLSPGKKNLDVLRVDFTDAKPA